VIPRFPHPWAPGTYPYDSFVGTGITPESSHATVLDGAFHLQAAGTLSQEIRRSWDEIRTLSRRLATDFFLYNPEWCEATGPAQEALRLLASLLERSDP
jgi:hypothetical protein